FIKSAESVVAKIAVESRSILTNTILLKILVSEVDSTLEKIMSTHAAPEIAVAIKRIDPDLSNSKSPTATEGLILPANTVKRRGIEANRVTSNVHANPLATLLYINLLSKVDLLYEEII